MLDDRDPIELPPWGRDEQDVPYEVELLRRLRERLLGERDE